MALTSQSYPVTIAEGIRAMVLGRVLLKEGASIGDETLVTGVEFASPWEKMNLTGTSFFYGETNLARVVQPAATNTPSGIEHYENVAISGLTINALNLPLSAALTKAYTTARGAYVRWRTAPTYASSINLVQEDFLQIGISAPEERLFPAIYVEEITTRLGARWSNVAWQETTRILVRYYEMMDSDYTRESFKETAVSILDVIRKDHTLGGTCYDSLAEVYSPGGQGQLQQRQVMASNGLQIDWADILVVAQRIIPYDKITAATD